MELSSIQLVTNDRGFVYKIYLNTALFMSTLFSLYIGLDNALKLFITVLLLDTITKVNAVAVNNGMKFRFKNFFKKEYWLIVESKGLRRMMNKLFMQYMIYFLIAYYVDNAVLKQMIIFTFNDQGFTLPVVSLLLFSAIECWSIGENIEEAGGVNIFKRTVHFLDEKYQKIFKKTDE